MRDWFKALSGGVLAIIAGLVVLLIFGVIGVFGFGWFQRSTADFRGQTKAIERTKGNANFRLAAYNEFFDQCSSVQSLEDRILIFERDATRFKGTPKEQEAITNLHALEAQRVSIIRDYNAKASRSFTNGQFRSRNLPYQLDVTDKETVCAIEPG